MLEGESANAKGTPTAGDDTERARFGWIYPYQHAVAGGIAGIISRALVTPLDVVKIRFQLQHAHPEKGFRYTGVAHCIATVLHKEGIYGLWKGHVPAQFLSISYSSVQFAAYHAIQTTDHWLLQNEFVSGGLGAITATAVTYPLDMLRTLLASRHCNSRYNMLEATGHIFQSQGITGLYKGIGPAVLSIGPNAGFSFLYYHTFKTFIVDMRHTEDRLGSLDLLICGTAAGMLGKISVMPLDTLKKRLQVQGQAVATTTPNKLFPVYSGAVHCCETIYHKEGIRGFYRGSWPAMLKAGPAAGVTFATYEFVLRKLPEFTQRIDD